MKKLFNTSIVIVIFLLIGGFSTQQNDNSTAKVQQVENVFVFYQAKPTNEFETLGQVKAGITFSGSPEELLKGLISNAKKKFPSGDAILIGDIGMSRADVIRFK